MDETSAARERHAMKTAWMLSVSDGGIKSALCSSRPLLLMQHSHKCIPDARSRPVWLRPPRLPLRWMQLWRRPPSKWFPKDVTALFQLTVLFQREVGGQSRRINSLHVDCWWFLQHKTFCIEPVAGLSVQAQASGSGLWSAPAPWFWCIPPEAASQDYSPVAAEMNSLYNLRAFEFLLSSCRVQSVLSKTL